MGVSIRVLRRYFQKENIKYLYPTVEIKNNVNSTEVTYIEDKVKYHTDIVDTKKLSLLVLLDFGICRFRISFENYISFKTISFVINSAKVSTIWMEGLITLILLKYSSERFYMVLDN